MLGLRLVDDPDDRRASFRLDDGAMLLIFEPSHASTPGRGVPTHGTTGAAHIAFSVGAGELDPFADALREHGVEIEQEVDWDGRGRSIYFRDPAGNVLELVEGDIWPP